MTKLLITIIASLMTASAFGGAAAVMAQAQAGMSYVA